MVVLAALVYLPIWAITGFGLLMIVTHNALDGIDPTTPWRRRRALAQFCTQAARFN